MWSSTPNRQSARPCLHYDQKYNCLIEKGPPSQSHLPQYHGQSTSLSPPDSSICSDWMSQRNTHMEYWNLKNLGICKPQEEINNQSSTTTINMSFSIENILAKRLPLTSRSADSGYADGDEPLSPKSMPTNSLVMGLEQDRPIDLSMNCNKWVFVDQMNPVLPVVICEGRFACHHCGKQYRARSSLRLHEATHTLPFSCTDCGKRFSRPWLRDIHHRTHTGEKPYACLTCGRRFADRSNARVHQRVHYRDVQIP